MFKIFLFSVLIFLFLLYSLSNADIPPDRLIAAMELRESSNDPYAIGDENLEYKAYGCLQLTQPCIDDYNKWHGTSYKAEDMLGNCKLSREICIAYINHYATKKRIGRKPTLEDMVRIINGGPNGYKKSSTIKHWIKVKRTLAKS